MILLLHRIMKYSSAVLSLTALQCCAAALASAPSMVVDLTVEGTDMPTKIAVQICSGLLNRGDSTVYTLMHQPYDSDWLQDTEQVTNPDITSQDDVLSKCMSSSEVKGYILYDYDSQKALVPNLITMAAVMDAVLLETGHPAMAGSSMVYDAVTEWSGFSGLDASKYMYSHYINDTTTLAWMNPGYDGHSPSTYW